MDVLFNIFKSYDVRGKVGSELTEDVAERIGRAMAQWLPNKGIVAVGRDMRPDSAALTKAMIKGLNAGGRNVYDIGLVTSDMIYFAVGKYDLAGGVMVTASHNPGEYNGIKLCREKAKPIGLESGLGLADIRDIVIKNDFADAAIPGRTEPLETATGWIEHVLSFVDMSKLTPLKLAVDTGNGMAGAVFPLLEKHVPWQITRLYFELDGTFPNHEANPLKFETLADLIQTVREKGLDGGVAFDGDGDRAFLVDETGTVLTGGVMSAMMSEYFLDKFPSSSIVYDARNSRSVREVIEEKGGKAVRALVGHSNIKNSMREADAPFGGEASGHFYFRDNWYADSGLIGVVIGLYVATLVGKKLSELRKQYTRYVAIPETNFEVIDKVAAIERIAQEFTDGEQDRFDGLTISYPDKWFNVRASNTEPVLRLNTEAKNQEDLEQLVAKVTKLIATS